MSAPNEGRVLRLQYGALAYRFTDTGALQILLITSRKTRRWIIPKGWPMKSLKPSAAAAREAYEEAGIRGTIGSKAIGSFVYEKSLDDEGRAVRCEVKVFPLLVKRQLKSWPEQRERDIRWVDPEEVASLVQDDGLRLVIDSFVARHRSR